MKRLLRPLFLRLARSLGVLDIHARMDELTRRVSIFEVGNESLDQLASRKATDAVIKETSDLWDRVVQDAEGRHRDLWNRIVERDDAVQSSVMEASRHHAELLVNEMRAHFDNENTKLKRGLDLVRSSSQGILQNKAFNQTEQVPSQASPIDDSLYVALEDKFRGEPELIRERQLLYIPFVKDIVTKDKPLLDLGCGRGEWLSVLRDAGIPAKGIDSNRACIEDCSQHGLTVELADLIEYLHAQPENSIGAITLFQVMEHLPFPLLLDVLRTSLRVLTPGGVLIGEVPNSETLSVGASTFWIDPTHERPLFPSLLTFLADQIGFAKTEGVYSSPLMPEPNVAMLPEELQQPFLAMFRQLYGPGDFALIATA